MYCVILGLRRLSSICLKQTLTESYSPFLVSPGSSHSPYGNMVCLEGNGRQDLQCMDLLPLGEKRLRAGPPSPENGTSRQLTPGDVPDRPENLYADLPRNS